MRPRTTDYIGAAILAVILIGLVAIIVFSSIPVEGA